MGKHDRLNRDQKRKAKLKKRAERSRKHESLAYTGKTYKTSNSRRLMHDSACFAHLDIHTPVCPSEEGGGGRRGGGPWPDRGGLTPVEGPGSTPFGSHDAPRTRRRLGASTNHATVP